MSKFLEAWHEVRQVADSAGYADECDTVDAEIERLKRRIRKLRKALRYLTFAARERDDFDLPKWLAEDMSEILRGIGGDEDE